MRTALVIVIYVGCRVEVVTYDVKHGYRYSKVDNLVVYVYNACMSPIKPQQLDWVGQDESEYSNNTHG